MTKAALALITSSNINTGDLKIGTLAAAFENAIAAAPQFVPPAAQGVEMTDLSQESPLWQWAESRHSVQQMREELDRLRAENARLIGDHAAALRLVTDVRAAIGDDGKLMQPELIEYCKAMKMDAERYQWLCAIATSGQAGDEVVAALAKAGVK